MTTKLEFDALTTEPGDFMADLFKAAPDMYFRDGIVIAMIEAGLPVIEATTSWLLAYVGENAFVRDVQRKVRRGKKLTTRQARALLNCASKEWTPQEGDTPSIGNPVPVAAPKPTLECYQCDEKFFTYPELFTHREEAHPQVLKCRASGCEHQTTDKAEYDSHRREHFKPLFDGVEQTGIDLHSIPTGRYAVPDLSTGGKDYIFLTVREVPRTHMRSKKYRYGWVSYGREEVLAGTLEVRRHKGDTKELVGEQRPDETYRGIFEREFKMIMGDPVASTKLFGRLINACGRCGRTLTDPESRADGIGPECIKHFHGRASMTSVHSTETTEELTNKLAAIGRTGTSIPTWGRKN